MDCNDKDELDYEEDLPINESKEIDEPENAEEEKINDSDNNKCDQYLQIDYLGDEEDDFSKVLLDSEKETYKTVPGKEPNAEDPANEGNKKSEKNVERAENKLEEMPPKSNCLKINRNKRKKRHFGVPLYRTAGSACSNRWRSNNHFTGQMGQNVGQGLTGSPFQHQKLHHFSQNYFENQNDFISLLGLSGSRSQNLQQMSNLLTHCSNPVLEVRNNFIRNGFLAQYSNGIPNQFQCNNFSRFKGPLQKMVACDANSKTFPVSFFNGFKNNYSRGSFHSEGHSEKNYQEGKNQIKSRKEARLFRFMNDDANRKEMKSNGNISERPSNESLNLEEEYFRKMKEQERKRQEIFNLKEKQNHGNEKSTADALAINKELLLRKENPFEDDYKILGSSGVKFEIKQEKEDETACQNGGFVSNGPGLVKKEAKSPVKFVRTVSKSFEELGLSRIRNGLFSRTDKTESEFTLGSDSLFDNVPKADFVDAASQTQTDSHLSGCIVKVLNLPPSKTANDVLELFRPFGIVKEWKFNLPKENSVAIRFAEPKSAENIFMCFNGRVIDSHTLNVIIV